MKHVFKRRPPLLGVLAVSALIALVCAVCSISSVSVLPPNLKSRNLEIGGAGTAVLVDLPGTIGSPRLEYGYFIHSLSDRAALLARLTTTEPALKYVAREAGISAGKMNAFTPVTAVVPSELIGVGSEQRARELLLAADPYRLEVQARPGVPIIDIYSQAPSPAQAERLADAAVAGLRDYLAVLATQEHLGAAPQVNLLQLGPARRGVLNSGAKVKIAALTFLFAFAVSSLLLLVLARFLAGRAEPEEKKPILLRQPARAFSARRMTLAALAPSPFATTAGALAVPGPAGALSARPWGPPVPLRGLVSHGGDWPRTSRVLPWLLAIFMAVLWLVPFDSISLKVSLPIDMKFDRLILPLIGGAWLLSLAARGRTAPRIRLTGIHIAAGVFVALAFLSVLVNATSLNQSLELDTSVKKLPLLLSYVSLFLIVASVVRLSEVRAFLSYTLTLALLCAIGMIVEWKTGHNVFFEWSGKLLPGAFTLQAPQSLGYDMLGRVQTHGPAQGGIAPVAMLAMALAIPTMRAIQAERVLPRILYGLVAGLLVVGMLATQKKTGLLAPACALLTLVWFRRREMLKMAPLAVLALIAVLIVSPGTINPVIKQFAPDQLGSGAPATTSDRAARWDAIRPDIWTHLVLGRGFGSYQPLGHRILDDQYLLQTIETGVLGVASFIALGISVFLSARATIRSRDPTRAPPALAGAAAAAVFLVVGVLFDSLSFAQVPYVFLYLAALAAVVVKAPETSRLTDVPHFSVAICAPMPRRPRRR